MVKYFKVYLLFFAVIVTSLLQNDLVSAQNAHIYNGSPNNATCLLVSSPTDNVGYGRFALAPNSHYIVNLGTSLRCQVEIVPGQSWTFLNFFKTNQDGLYTLTRQQVNCPTCNTPGNMRWATVVKLPNGTLLY